MFKIKSKFSNFMFTIYKWYNMLETSDRLGGNFVTVWAE